MRGERGSGTVLVLGLTALLLFAAMTATTLAAVAVARHRAGSAADLAALAAASRVTAGATAACAAGSEVARAAGADLLQCRVRGREVDVEAAARPPGPLGRLGQATVRARAGPA